MIEIIPNYHPIVVHFTIALLSISVLFYLIRLLLPINHPWKEQWLNMANWSLWTGSIFIMLTVIAGWFAYNSVAHDTASHAAMTLHRNWAVPTALFFLVLAISSINLARKRIMPGFKFLSVSVIAAVLLMVTGWLGAEAVYRYGLGVMSLPQVEEGADGHNNETSTSEMLEGISEQHHDAVEHAHSVTEKTMIELIPPIVEEQANHSHDAMEESPVQDEPSDDHNHTH